MAIVNVHADGTVHYRASGLGSCLTSLIAARQQYREMPPPPSLQKIFDAGHIAEDIAVAKLLDAGWDVSGQQDEVVLEVDPGVYVVGHIDGLATLLPPWDTSLFEEYVANIFFDVKSQGESAWTEAERAASIWDLPLFHKYLWQFSVYRHCLDRPAAVVRINRVTEALAIHAIPDELLYSVDDIKNRVRAVEAWAERDELPECLELRWGCPYAYLHSTWQTEEVFPFVHDLDVYDKLIRAYKDADDRERQAKEDKEAARRSLIETMQSDEIDKVLGTDGTKVKLTSYDTRRLDKKLVQQAGIDLDPFYKSVAAQRLTVSTPGMTEETTDDATD